MSFLGGCIDIDDLTEISPGVVAGSRPVPNTAEDLTEVFHGNGVIATATTAENASLICRALNHCYTEWLKERDKT